MQLTSASSWSDRREGPSHGKGAHMRQTWGFRVVKPGRGLREGLPGGGGIEEGC